MNEVPASGGVGGSLGGLGATVFFEILEGESVVVLGVGVVLESVDDGVGHASVNVGRVLAGYGFAHVVEAFGESARLAVVVRSGFAMPGKHVVAPFHRELLDGSFGVDDLAQFPKGRALVENGNDPLAAGVDDAGFEFGFDFGLVCLIGGDFGGGERSGWDGGEGIMLAIDQMQHGAQDTEKEE